RAPAGLEPVLAAPLGQGGAAGRELLDALVAVVGYVDVALGIQGDAMGEAELAWAAAQAPPLGYRLAARRQLLDAVVVRVGHVQVAVGVDRRAPRQTQPPRRARLAAFRQPLARGAEHLDAPFATVAHVDVALLVHGDAGRGVELARTRAARADQGQRRAVA